MPGTWLITGGAGYIGAHVVRSLLAQGESAVVLDDLSTGRAQRVPPGVPLVRASVADAEAVAAAVRAHGVDGAIHLAAKKDVGESVARPAYYYESNVGGLAVLLETLTAAGVGRFVFSSSAAVYGMPGDGAITEDATPAPMNPYGETKLVGEWLVRAHAAATGMRFALLRYFNVAGAAVPELGDVGGTNLIPRVLEALRAGRAPQVFGSDYDTPDGTCVRDYIHVADLADAHVAVLPLLTSSDAVFNVGRGHGYSVLEVVAAARRHSGVDLAPDLGPRRPGDPAVVVASPAALHDAVGWHASRDLDTMVADAWAAQSLLG